MEGVGVMVTLQVPVPYYSYTFCVGFVSGMSPQPSKVRNARRKTLPAKIGTKDRQPAALTRTTDKMDSMGAWTSSSSPRLIHHP